MDMDLLLTVFPVDKEHGFWSLGKIGSLSMLSVLLRG
jgi:hypothetical protein